MKSMYYCLLGTTSLLTPFIGLVGIMVRQKGIYALVLLESDLPKTLQCHLELLYQIPLR